MENVLTIMVVAILVEAIWENLKMVWQEGKANADSIGALIISILVAICTNIDIFNLLSINISIPFVGSFLTGIIISRGANVFHDILAKIQNLKGE